MTTTQNKRFGWIDHQWGNINELKIPLSDRGLNLADGIFETILILDGKPQLLNEHLKRWVKSAKLLGMNSPPQGVWIKSLIQEGIDKGSLRNKHASVRLNWSRGDAETRKIDIRKDSSSTISPRFWLEMNSFIPTFNPISTIISQKERRNGNSLISLCKTFGYGQAIQAKREALEQGCDDALLLDTKGVMSCGSTSNLIIQRGDLFLTPELTSGCLPGIMRQQGLNKGIIHEERISPEPENNDKWLLINSLSCHPIKSIGKVRLNTVENPQAFWELLLSK